jgi:hypothetical protein
MLRRVALVRTDVSEERSASIIRMIRIGDLGTFAVISTGARYKEILVLLRSVLQTSFLQEPHCVTSQKTLFHIVTAVKTPNHINCLCIPSHNLCFSGLSDISGTAYCLTTYRPTNYSYVRLQPCQEAESPNRLLTCQENVVLYIHSPLRLHCIMLSSLRTGTALHTCAPFNTGISFLRSKSRIRKITECYNSSAVERINHRHCTQQEQRKKSHKKGANRSTRCIHK